MTIEREIREHLHKKAETMECPSSVSKRVQQSYSDYVQQKRSEKTMKKRLIGGMIAAAILIPTAAFATPTLIEILTRKPLTAEEVKVDEVGKKLLEKLHQAFPETTSFEIINASHIEGVQTSITLQEKGGTGKRISLRKDGTSGEIDEVNQENWEPQEKPIEALTEKEIQAKVDFLIEKMYGSVKKYEFSIEQMENPNQKTWILNYVIKGSNIPSYQVFVQRNAINVSRLGEDPTPSEVKVKGFFSENGQPDGTADSFLNDPKLFALLNMSPTELKQELTKGKTVVEVAAAKHVSKQQVIDVIAKTQVDNQFKFDNNGDASKNKRAYEYLLKDIERKVIPVIEHKTETPWN